MAAITWLDVAGVARELGGAAIDAVAQEAILAVANAQLSVATWGGEASPKLRLGRIYYAAHLATMGRRRGNPGGVSSESAGGLSRSYVTPQLSTTSVLQTTSYGQMFVALARTTAARAGISLNRGGQNSDPGWG